MADKLFNELPQEPDWEALRSDLARAVRWKFYKGEVAILPDVYGTRLLVERLKEEQENQEFAAVDALVGAGPVRDPMQEPIIKLGKKLGLSPEEAFTYAVELLDLGMVTRYSRISKQAVLARASNHSQL